MIPWKPSNIIILDMASVKPHSKAETFLIFSQIDQNIRRVYSKELSQCDDFKAHSYYILVISKK